MYTFRTPWYNTNTVLIRRNPRWLQFCRATIIIGNNDVQEILRHTSFVLIALRGTCCISFCTILNSLDGILAFLYRGLRIDTVSTAPFASIYCARYHQHTAVYDNSVKKKIHKLIPVFLIYLSVLQHFVCDVVEFCLFRYFCFKF